MTRKAEGTAQIQIEAYRQENARLLKLLSQTKEYADFAGLAQDSGLGVRYMNPIENEQAPSPNKSCREKKQEPVESDDWIPEEAYKVAHDFRNKCAANISKALMNTLLNDLNKIWRAREKKQISRVKADMTREVAYLRREVSFKKPYDQVMHEQDVKRLKAELKDA